MRVVKAAAVQLSPVLYSREGTVEKVELLLETAAR
jgi:predicted amidohydrolase